MSFIKTTGEKKLMLFSGRAHPELAEAVAEEVGIELTPTTAYDFANGEIFVRYKESVRGCDAFVLQSHPFPLNKWLMEQFIMVDALKRASAKRITVVAPFYGYARQDKKHRGREPISARLVADLFKAAGAHRLMTVDLHTSQIQGFFDGPVDHLIDTSGTIIKAADALFDNGAAEVLVAATHAVLSGPAVDRLKNSRVSEVVVTDTLPIPPERRFDKLTVLPIAPILANAISQVFTDGSVTSLFDGHS